jgi:hypothetical protein
MRDEPGVQEIADVGGVAAAGVLVVVGDQRAKLGGAARFRRGLRRVDERADLVLGRAGWAAARTGERREERGGRATQAAPPTAAGRR